MPVGLLPPAAGFLKGSLFSWSCPCSPHSELPSSEVTLPLGSLRRSVAEFCREEEREEEELEFRLWRPL